MHVHGLRSRTVWQSLELSACEVGVGGEKQEKYTDLKRESESEKKKER